MNKLGFWAGMGWGPTAGTAMAAFMIFGAPGASLAQSTVEACKQQIFQHADTNSDGKLSPSEAAANPLNLDHGFFNLADRNQDGTLDRKEHDDALTFISCELCPALPDCGPA